MTDIIKVESNIPKNILRIELFLSNVCNYSCWYCFKGYHEGDVPWPKFEKVKNSLEHIINYYKTNANKSEIQLHIIGGEPTLWREFSDFVKYFSEEHKCVISMSSNGSRTLRWWEQYGDYVDHTMLSCHHERVNSKHIADVADILYSKNKTVNAMVLMDPTAWDKCKSIVEDLEQSKYQWPITVTEVHNEKQPYTVEQKEYFRNALKRMPNIKYWLSAEKFPRNNPTITFLDGTEKEISRNWLSLNNKNIFTGWECNIGIDTFFIDKTGDIRGACGQPLYNLDTFYNIYDTDFVNNFTPVIQPVICKKNGICDCQPETNARKKSLL
jgi:organic radical activating enzyme